MSFQVYEKLISGMYLGELTRLVLLDVIEQGILFNGNKNLGKKLHKKGSFPTWLISQVS
jgi:hexokinase